MTVWYMNGAGNDFAVLDARGMQLDESRTAIELCSMRGCDGFMALDTSTVADFKLRFYNRDGSRAETCGNGLRCICRFAYDNGIVGQKMKVETDAGIVEGKRISEDVYQVKLNAPRDMAFNKKEGVDYAVVGVPHAAVEVKALDFNDSEELFEIGRRLRYETDANVNFYEIVDGKTVKILTYERGVEDFTLACGTGSSAVAAILFSKGELNGDTLTVRNRGGELTVRVSAEDGKINALYLQGKAEFDEICEY